MKMKPYRTANSTEGLRLPHSPAILGAIAKALRLNSSAHPRYKSAQRYFDGKRIKPEMVEEVLLALVDAAVPKGIALPEEQLGNPLELHKLVLGSLRSYAQRWDHFVAEVNANLFPVSKPSDLPVPVLRLLALDLGIRYGGGALLGNRLGLADRPLKRNIPVRCFGPKTMRVQSTHESRNRLVTRLFREGGPTERRALIAELCDRITLTEDGVHVELAPPFAILAGADPAFSPERGANRTPGAPRGPKTRARTTSRPSPKRRTDRISCPAGANPQTAAEKSLNKRKSRASGAARTTSFSAWCPGQDSNLHKTA